MTGGGVSWSAPGWVGVSDGKYSELIQRKAVAVTRRDKRRGGQYTVKQAIEAINEAFHRCNGSDPYDGSKLDPKLLGTYDNDDAKAEGAEYKRRLSLLPPCWAKHLCHLCQRTIRHASIQKTTSPMSLMAPLGTCKPSHRPDFFAFLKRRFSGEKNRWPVIAT